jgi:hypothetical protein
MAESTYRRQRLTARRARRAGVVKVAQLVVDVLMRRQPRKRLQRGQRSAPDECGSLVNRSVRYLRAPSLASMAESSPGLM